MTPFRYAALALLVAAPAAAQVSAPIATVDIPASTIQPTEADLARRYQDKAQADPDNAQAWTACAAAAARQSDSPAEADDYAVQMAKVLKLIVPDPSRSPCEDAIAPALWAAAGSAKPVTRPAPVLVPPAEAEHIRLQEEAAKADAEERARVTELNRQAAERAKAETEKILADKQAAVKARDDYRTAQAQYDANKARVDAARAAQADYDRQMREYRAKYGKAK